VLVLENHRTLTKEDRTLDMADVRVGFGVEFFAPKSLFMMAVAEAICYWRVFVFVSDVLSPKVSGPQRNGGVEQLQTVGVCVYSDETRLLKVFGVFPRWVFGVGSRESHKIRA